MKELVNVIKSKHRLPPIAEEELSKCYADVTIIQKTNKHGNFTGACKYMCYGEV